MAYADIDAVILWNTVSYDIPPLLEQVQKIYTNFDTAFRFA